MKTQWNLLDWFMPQDTSKHERDKPLKRLLQLAAFLFIGICCLGMYATATELFNFFEFHGTAVAIVSAALAILWEVLKAYSVKKVASDYFKHDEKGDIIPLLFVLVVWGGSIALSIYGIELKGNKHGAKLYEQKQDSTQVLTASVLSSFSMAPTPAANKIKITKNSSWREIDAARTAEKTAQAASRADSTKAASLAAAMELEKTKISQDSTAKAHQLKGIEQKSGLFTYIFVFLDAVLFLFILGAEYLDRNAPTDPGQVLTPDEIRRTKAQFYAAKHEYNKTQSTAAKMRMEEKQLILASVGIDVS